MLHLVVVILPLPIADLLIFAEEFNYDKRRSLKSRT